MFSIISMLLTFKNFLTLLRHRLEFLKILAILVPTSYKPVSYKKPVVKIQFATDFSLSK